MTNPLDSNDPKTDISGGPKLSAWVKVSAIAAVSALAGGLAAAWFYRNTLTHLQQADTESTDTNFGISSRPRDDEG